MAQPKVEEVKSIESLTEKELLGSCLEQIDPFQQGGGCSAARERQQTCWDSERRASELDTSFIPQEDCGTQKVTNMIQLEQASAQLRPPALMSPRSPPRQASKMHPKPSRLRTFRIKANASSLISTDNNLAQNKEGVYSPLASATSPHAQTQGRIQFGRVFR